MAVRMRAREVLVGPCGEGGCWSWTACGCSCAKVQGGDGHARGDEEGWEGLDWRCTNLFTFAWKVKNRGQNALGDESFERAEAAVSLLCVNGWCMAPVVPVRLVLLGRWLTVLHSPMSYAHCAGRLRVRLKTWAPHAQLRRVCKTVAARKEWWSMSKCNS